ncbi:uncharacterized protein LOC143228247 [Tachypleus tridentatus]|uniref:uncharacterized protein LOC143228247 n=1 Tax=Tachypleus tridentatus TaxID=6853 RepID=UPI003FD59600
MTEIWDNEAESRPCWELEADVLRLTTRLMKRERELRQMKIQMTSQVQKTRRLVLVWKTRALRKEQELTLVLEQKDKEMNGIISQLLLFQSGMQREQKQIEKLLLEKDKLIRKQEAELVSLRKAKLDISFCDQSQQEKKDTASHLQNQAGTDKSALKLDSENDSLININKEENNCVLDAQHQQFHMIKHYESTEREVNIEHDQKCNNPENLSAEVLTCGKEIFEKSKSCERLKSQKIFPLNKNNNQNVLQVLPKCQENYTRYQPCKSFHMFKGHNILETQGIKIISAHLFQL